MKPLSTALDALFQTRQFVSCDLYAFALANGGTAYVTSAEIPVTWAGNTYQPTPLTDRTAIKQKIGLEVTSLDITLYPDATDTILGVTWLTAIRRGMFDQASVTITRLFGNSFTSWVDGVVMLAGRVADAQIGRSKGKITVNGWTDQLANQMPRNYYQSPCGNTLFDAACGVNRAAYGNAGTITDTPNGPNALALFSTLDAADGYYNLGTIRMETGVCAGEWRPISYSGQEYGALVLQIPFSVPPAAGDEFIAYAGCDKQSATCQYKFNNLARFRGFPYIPAPVMAI